MKWIVFIKVNILNCCLTYPDYINKGNTT